MNVEITHITEYFCDSWRFVEPCESIEDQLASPSFEYGEGTALRFSDGFDDVSYVFTLDRWLSLGTTPREWMDCRSVYSMCCLLENVSSERRMELAWQITRSVFEPLRDHPHRNIDTLTGRNIEIIVRMRRDAERYFHTCMNIHEHGAIPSAAYAVECALSILSDDTMFYRCFQNVLNYRADCFNALRGTPRAECILCDEIRYHLPFSELTTYL